MRLKIEGSSLEELFTAAIEGMAELTKEGILKKTATLTEEVLIRAPNVTVLLIDFLSKVLTLQHINKAVYYKIDFINLTEQSINAKILGSKEHSFDEDIKAVTYHEVNVIKNHQGNLETVILFDI